MGQGWCRSPPPHESAGATAAGATAARAGFPDPDEESPIKRHVEAEKILEEPFKVNSKETCSFFCLYFVYLSIIPFLFAFLYHAFPTTILLIAFFLLLCSFLPIAFHRGDIVVSEPTGPLLAASMLAFNVIVIMGSLRNYYGHVQPMRNLLLAREYKGVYPQLPSVAFGDASFLKFAGSTHVDTSKAVSFKSLDSGLTTFCVAPIVNEANNGRIEFWAIGTDCCGESGKDFDCGDSRDKSAKNAWVMKDIDDAAFHSFAKYISPRIVRRDIFRQAISKAEHTKHVSTGEEPLLVRWTKESRQDVIKKEAFLVFVNLLVWTLLSGVMALVLTRINHRYATLRKAHRHRVAGPQSEDQDVTARLNEFLQGLDDDFDVDTARFAEMRPPLSAKDTCLMSVLLPYVVMMLCVCATTYSSCWSNGHLVTGPFYVTVGILIVALLATPNRVLNGLFLLLVALTGLMIGYENYEKNMFHYCRIEDSRTYTDVRADADSKDYSDAGIIKFETHSRLSQNHSVGFLYKDVTYCVAPIIAEDSSCVQAKKDLRHGHLKDAKEGSSLLERRPLNLLQRTSRMQSSLDLDDEDSSEEDDDGARDEGMSALQAATVPASCKKVTPKSVEFWAIGTNCCGDRKDFRCDGGKDGNARSGAVVRAVGPEEPGNEREQFRNAVDQAIAAYELPVPERTVFIRWGSDAKDLQNDWKTKATVSVLFTAVVGLLALMACGFGGHFYMMYERSVERKEKEKNRALEQGPAAQQARGGYPAGGTRDQLRV